MNKIAVAAAKTLSSILLSAALITLPASAQECTRCCLLYGPNICQPQLLYNNYFYQGCGWTYGGDAVETNGYAELGDEGTDDQDVTIPRASSVDLQFDLDVVPGGATGINRLNVEVITSSGTTLLGYFNKTSADGTYHFDMTQFAGQSITLRFRTEIGLHSSGTVFRIDNATMFPCS